MFDPGETTPKDEHTASENDSATLVGDYTALQEGYAALEEFYTALQETCPDLKDICTVLREIRSTLMNDDVASKNSGIPVADGGNGDGATDSKASLEHAPADLPKGMEMPVELSKKALASDTGTEHSSPSGDLAQGITDPWVQDETALRVNPVSSPVCKGVMEDDRFEPNSRITDGDQYAAGGELLIVGQALDAQTPGF
ncbi:hypothetical protein D5041_06010 [Verminephrobacter aporrectodeae subsp. tuberculatae]|uniref:Uncharacterized protein n=1 Tax=Verminephrobacter aporrectodeae subsp. tuberculatae TaxID=1110392 RepID=A0ABT3KV55_9BURK|nr:hypothetical protein [Verminephrobacter aporrectodeae]MCW5223164.1 hypothetical protein [Verminephrobacter aporrectodeae subsp. tuberculatae]MCW5288628.1 hypothetical protein [Verminephrobacter aporrectodeae subsp. tuberculatae]MCW5322217.1 hypothetical protein [Verminephrobacter aporrectodeae subsp. tuberculatae]